jgi:NAD(P)-dependent dehydrogenase (short-subunit alcohol dehydrogenase family)
MANRTVLVTGAASGIGLACARLLGAEGERVAALDLDASRLAYSLPPDGKHLLLLSGDVTRADSCTYAVSRAVERFGQLDALIHCAAVLSDAPWDALTAEEMNQTLAVNVTGAFLIAQAAARAMAAHGRGAIVLAGSDSVLSAPAGAGGAAGPAYVASKGAILALTRSLSRALAPKGIRVNSIAPGLTDTPMIEGISERTRAAIIARVPERRLGLPEEVARAAIFLISDAASFISGQTLYANGGANFG